MTYHPNDVARRARVASILLMAIFGFLTSAFFRTQIVHHSRFARLSELNRIEVVPLPAPRGTIFDRQGRIIAENVPGFSVLLQTRGMDSLALRAALERINELAPLRPGSIDRLVKTRNPQRPVVVLSNATFEQVALLEEHKMTHFPGLVIQVTPKRHYPAGREVAAFVGYTKEIGEGELASPRYEGYKQGQQIGSLGLEEQYERMLAGIEGRRFVEVDAPGRIVRVDGVRPPLPPTPGTDLQTTIDLDFQTYVVDSVFGDTLRAGIIAMDPRTGEVLALHSAPTFDPNDFIGGISTAKYSALLSDPRLPMVNKVLRGLYAPASTFKLVTAVVGLEEKVVRLGERMPVACRGSITMGNREFRCWKPEGHGAVTLEEAIEGSCNVYFYQLGQRIGFSRLMAAGIRMGFAERTGIDLPDERQPIMPSGADWYTARYPRGNWSAASAELNIAIGQGEVTQSVASMARFYTALASDGHAVAPRLVKGVPERVRLYNISPEEQRGIQNALAGVVSQGTAIGSRQADLAIAGKTGTAQDPRGAHAWFVGYAPAENPQLVIAVLVEHGLSGATAARYASRMFAYYFKNTNVRMISTDG